MSNRAARRAAERLTNKMTAQATATHTISEAQLNANRANAQSSTGPTSPQGRATSSMNAVKTGLTGRTVLLPSDDAIVYQQQLDRVFAQYAPATDREKALVQTIVDTEWRLLRIAPLEAGIYAIGQRELADRFPDERNPLNRQALIQAEIFRTYRRELSNLALQERRLRNHRQTDIAELEKLQQERLEKAEREAKKNAAKPAPNGFVFSTSETTTTPSASPSSSLPADGNESSRVSER